MEIFGCEWRASMCIMLCGFNFNVTIKELRGSTVDVRTLDLAHLQHQRVTSTSLLQAAGS